MDFIEKLFNLSPDGGSGLTEASILIALVLVVTLCMKFRLVHRSRGRRDGS
jgi:hypothetical protein